MVPVLATGTGGDTETAAQHRVVGGGRACAHAMAATHIPHNLYSMRPHFRFGSFLARTRPQAGA